ncbi:MAG TPA: hypothetical protein VL175_16000 [Pirellulales bacterium]|jgi:hypothetical protein|nr:hypothetical protein [Pirellulales bacterium]
MNFAAIAIVTCLWAQQPAEGEQNEPHLRPIHKAPAADFEDEPADAHAQPARHVDNPQQPALHTNEEPAQHAPRREHQPPAEPEAERGDAEPARPRIRPPDLLIEALETLRGGAVTGTPLSLQSALAGTTERAQQLKIAQAYWRLCLAQADYNWLRNDRDLLASYTQAHTDQPALLSARASARANMRDAQLAVSQAQDELSDLMPRRGEQAPPLASDRPHVGDYNTQYETIFASQAPAPRLRLVHRTLPVRRKAIEAHAAAILAGLDAVESSGEEFKQHGSGLVTLLSALDQLRRERQAFLNNVRAYNQEIAEYAFAVAPPGTNGATLVSMLIKTSRPARNGPNRSGYRGFNSARASLASRDLQDEIPVEQTALYAANDDVGLYQALLQVESPQRVQKLGNLLHWDRNLPPDSGNGATLAECLRSVDASRRLGLIRAYWRARERAARYQALVDQVEQLSALPVIAIEKRARPELGVRLQAARRAARAATYDAHAQLLAAEFELTQAAGRRLDEPWLVPSTAPQSGRYIVDVSRRATTPARYWGERVRLEHEKLEERADALIRADVDRAQLVSEARAAQTPPPGAGQNDTPAALDVLLSAIERQNAETMAFLHDLTEYNVAIAHYVLVAWPDPLPSDELVRKLVVPRSTRRDT